MEWIIIGICIAIGFYLAPLVVMVILAIIGFIVSIPVTIIRILFGGK